MRCDLCGHRGKLSTMCSACKTNLVLKLELKQNVGEDMKPTRENVECVVRCLKFELLEESKG